MIDLLGGAHGFDDLLSSAREIDLTLQVLCIAKVSVVHAIGVLSEWWCQTCEICVARQQFFICFQQSTGEMKGRRRRFDSS